MTTTMTRSHDEASRRVEKLSHASLRKIIDPDVDLPGEVGPGQVLPDELLSIHELPEFAGLTREQRATLSREETASVIDGVLQPEEVRLVWGKTVNAGAVVIAVAERLEHFAPSGAPRRSWMSMRLRRVPDAAATARPRAPAAPPPGADTGSGAISELHMVLGGGGSIPTNAYGGTPTAPTAKVITGRTTTDSEPATWSAVRDPEYAYGFATFDGGTHWQGLAAP